MTTYQVTFKNEGTLDEGTIYGPCRVIDLTAMEADPQAQGPGLPYGYRPAWLDDRGWMTQAEAELIAAGYGVDLVQS